MFVTSSLVINPSYPDSLIYLNLLVCENIQFVLKFTRMLILCQLPHISLRIFAAEPDPFCSGFVRSCLCCHDSLSDHGW